MRTIQELKGELRGKKFSSVELTREYLEVIRKKNSELNAVVIMNEENSLAMAKRADEMIQRNEGTELTGIHLGVKDVFSELGMETTACSKILKGFFYKVKIKSDFAGISFYDVIFRRCPKSKVLNSIGNGFFGNFF